jgi:uncharacterized protein (DUF58 family)
MFTLEGIVFIILAILIGAAAMNTGTNLLYLILSLMMAFLLVSGFLSLRTMKKLRVTRSLPKHIVAGQPADVSLSVRNRKRVFASYGIQAQDYMEDGTAAGVSFFVRIAPQWEETVRYPLVFNRRGIYRFSHCVLSTTYPFGFIRRSAVVACEREVLVYPHLLSWRELGIEDRLDIGERESGRKGAGSSLYGIREQQPEEGARWIHWKKTAQLDRLMRREFESEEKQSVSIVLDNGLPDPADAAQSEAFERAVVMAASIAHHLLRAENQVELLTRSGRVPVSAGPQQVHRILRALAVVEPVTAAGQRRGIRLSPRADAATILIHCNGHGPVGKYPRGTQVCTIDAPEALSETPSHGTAAVSPAGEVA